MTRESILDGKKILAVDDEPDVLETLVDLLPMCEVVKATTFQEAKDMLESRDFDLAILDIMGVGGYRLLDIANRRKITAVMLTAYAFTPANIVRSIKEGAASYIPKEELADIKEFLIDVLHAQKKGINPWEPWQQRLPPTYFEKRFGAAWQENDKEFWERFRASIKARRSKSATAKK